MAKVQVLSKVFEDSPQTYCVNGIHFTENKGHRITMSFCNEKSCKGSKKKSITEIKSELVKRIISLFPDRKMIFVFTSKHRGEHSYIAVNLKTLIEHHQQLIETEIFNAIRLLPGESCTVQNHEWFKVNPANPFESGGFQNVTHQISNFNGEVHDELDSETTKRLFNIEITEWLVHEEFTEDEARMIIRESGPSIVKDAFAIAKSLTNELCLLGRNIHGFSRALNKVLYPLHRSNVHLHEARQRTEEFFEEQNKLSDWLNSHFIHDSLEFMRIFNTVNRILLIWNPSQKYNAA